MKPSEIYLRAAKYLQKTELVDGLGVPARCGCCDLINFVARSDPCSESLSKKQFEELFKPRDTCWAYWGEHWSDDYDEVRECRLLALLLMAEIAKELE